MRGNSRPRAEGVRRRWLARQPRRRMPRLELVGCPQLPHNFTSIQAATVIFKKKANTHTHRGAGGGKMARVIPTTKALHGSTDPPFFHLTVAIPDAAASEIVDGKPLGPEDHAASSKNYKGADSKSKRKPKPLPPPPAPASAAPFGGGCCSLFPGSSPASRASGGESS